MAFITGTMLLNFAIQAAIAVSASAIINFIFPIKIEGPRLSDLKIQVSTYGRAIALLFGTDVRVAGNVIDSTGLTEHVNTESAKGGGEITTYSYTTDVAILIGAGRPNSRLKKIWGNGKLIYDIDAFEDSSGLPPAIFAILVALKGSVGAALTNFVRFYPGDFEQEPDSFFESVRGVGNVPAYRGSMYVVIQGLQLADFGNVLPNLEFLIEANPDETYRTAVEEIVELSGITEEYYNFDCLDMPLRGYAIGRVMSASQALTPLTFAGNFDIIDDGGNLRSVFRDDGAVAIISTEDLGGHQFGDDRPDPITFERAPVVALPNEATIVYNDVDRDFQEGAQRSPRAGGTADSNIAVEIAMSLTADEAKALADRALWESWMITQTAKTTVTERLIDIKVGRVYLFETPAGYEPWRIMSKNVGRNGVIELELKRERAEIYDATQFGASAPTPPNETSTPGFTELELLDIPIMRDADDDPGFYYAVVGSETGWRGAAVMRALSISHDYSIIATVGVQSAVGDCLNTLADGPTELDFGEGTFDDVNYLDVDMRHAGLTLESVDDDSIEAGFNAAFVGNPDDTTEGEIIQFGTVTLLSGDTYRLSHLKRGKRGTEFATGLHASGEIFAMLTTGTTKRANFGTPDLNLERAYKGVSILHTSEMYDPILFTNTGVGLRPYSPRDLGVSGGATIGSAGSDGDIADIFLAWTRRSRLDSGVLGEATELYTVRIMDGTNTAVVREVQVTEQGFTYTEDMQIADFGDVVSHLCWRVAQVSAVYGNGIFAESCGAVIESSGAQEEELSRFEPQGRLTLTTLTPVMSADVTAAGTVYYTPHVGNFIPIYDGAEWVRTEFAEISQTLADTTKQPAAIGTNVNADAFVWDDAGTVRLCFVAWTSGAVAGNDTARGTGAGSSALEMIDGILTNDVAITNGPGANEGTYVGTVRTDGSSQCNMIINPAAAAGGTANRLDVWNAYNQEPITLQNNDSDNTWPYTTLVWRQRNGNANSQIKFVVGLPGTRVSGTFVSNSLNTTANINRHVTISLDVTNAVAGGTIGTANAAANGLSNAVATYESRALLGFHFLAPLEISVATGACSWLGDNNQAGERWSPFNVTIMA